MTIRLVDPPGSATTRVVEANTAKASQTIVLTFKRRTFMICRWCCHSPKRTRRCQIQFARDWSSGDWDKCQSVRQASTQPGPAQYSYAFVRANVLAGTDFS